MLNAQLLLTCLLCGGLAVALVGIAHLFGEKYFVPQKGSGSRLVGKGGLRNFGQILFLDLAFYVAIPTIAYAAFYVILPFSGVRSGLATALIATLIGAAPTLLTLGTRTRLPVSFLLYQLLGQLLKAAAGLSVIAWLYHL